MSDSSYNRDDSSPEALEHEVNAERGRVAETLDALQEKMSVGNLADDVVRSFSRYGGDIGRNLAHKVRENPIPLLLTGIGLAWMMTSSGRSRPRYRDEDYIWDYDDELNDDDYASTRRYGTADVRPYGTAGVSGTYSDDDDGGMAGRVSGAAGSAARSVGSTAGSAASGVGRAAGSAASGVGSAANSVASGASHAAGSAARGVSGAAGSVASGASHAAGSAARGVSSAAGAVARGAGSAADAVSSGVGRAAGAVSDGARSAGETMGRRAYEARRRAYEASRHSARRVGNFYEEQPLVVGALALAVGAAIGGALPRTRIEDEYIGDYSDRAKEMARETAEREADKARRVAGAVADEATKVVDEKADELRRSAPDAKSVTERAKAEATSVAERIRDRAMSEAEKQDLGVPKKPA